MSRLSSDRIQELQRLLSGPGWLDRWALTPGEAQELALSAYLEAEWGECEGMLLPGGHVDLVSVRGLWFAKAYASDDDRDAFVVGRGSNRGTAMLDLRHSLEARR